MKRLRQFPARWLGEVRSGWHDAQADAAAAEARYRDAQGALFAERGNQEAARAYRQDGESARKRSAGHRAGAGSVRRVPATHGRSR